jgi:hypothetical protein
VRLDHSIFRGPLSVDVVLDDAHPWEGEGTWLVHEGEFKAGCDVGMVSDGHGFEDSPDCERISGGVNSKGPMAVAIGRQANLLGWGFYGAPDRMTESAKRAFLNSIVYMRQFDGHVPLVRKVSTGRTWLAQYVDAVAKLTPEQLKEQGDQTYAAYLKKQFPAELVKQGVDADRLRAWYDANVEYVRSEKRSFTVDQDLAALKLSNRKPELLDWLEQTLTGDSEHEVALRLAKRYLGDEAGADAGKAVAWIRANRPYAFFTDTGGYRWMVDRNAQRAAVAEPGRRGQR